MELNTTRSNFKGAFPPYKRPLVMGFFSVDEQGRYFSSTKNCSYLQWSRFSSRNINMDLTKGEDISIKRTEESDNSYYRYLADHPNMVHNFSAKSLDQVGFICNRGVLRKIANIPYQERDDELFSAYLYQGNIYINHIKFEDQPPNERWHRCSRWGYKFEQYMLSSRPGAEPITNVPVKEAEEFGCVFETQLNEHRILFAAEMDGIFIDLGERQTPVPDTRNFSEEAIIEDLRKRKFVELKTSSYSETNATFRKAKSRDYWLQSFFSGVEILVIGIRNYNGIVSQLKRFNTWDMLELGEAFWNPDICMNFCEKFLSFIKQCFANELSHCPEWTAECDIRTLPPMELFFERNIYSNVTLCKEPENTQRPYLHKWFIDSVKHDYNT